MNAAPSLSSHQALKMIQTWQTDTHHDYMNTNSSGHCLLTSRIMRDDPETSGLSQDKHSQTHLTSHTFHFYPFIPHSTLKNTTEINKNAHLQIIFTVYDPKHYLSIYFVWCFSYIPLHEHGEQLRWFDLERICSQHSHILIKTAGEKYVYVIVLRPAASLPTWASCSTAFSGLCRVR